MDRVEAFLFGVRHLQCLVLLGIVFRFRILMKARRWWQLEHGGAPLYKHQNMVVSISFWTPSSLLVTCKNVLAINPWIAQLRIGQPHSAKDGDHRVPRLSRLETLEFRVQGFFLAVWGLLRVVDFLTTTPRRTMLLWGMSMVENGYCCCLHAFC